MTRTSHRLEVGHDAVDVEAAEMSAGRWADSP
jgi:hypothetical protein